MSQRTSKRKVGTTRNEEEDSLHPCETQTSKKSKNKSDAKANLNTAGRVSARGTRKRKIEGGARGETTQEDDECGEPKADAKATTSTSTNGEGEKDGAKRARRAVVNHRINSALLQKARLLEKNVLPGVDLHYVIDRRLNQTDIEWKLRSTAVGLVVQLPYGLGEGPRRKLLDDVRGRILAQSKDTKRRTTLAVLKKANMVAMRAKFGGMRYTAVQAFDNSSYMVLGNLPDHDKVAHKLAELKARIVPLLVQFNVELRELKEIVAQSLRGRIFTNKDHAAQYGGRVTARIDLRVRQFTNLEKLRSDRGLMITLIHELAHAITPSDVKQVKGRGKVKMSHGPLFWENVMRIAKVASEIEDPTWNRRRSGDEVSGDESEEGGEGPERRQQQQQLEEEGDGGALDLARRKRVIFEVKDELEFRKKIEQEDSLTDELGDDDDDNDPPQEEMSS